MKAHDQREEIWPWAFGGAAILFNPFIPIHLSKGVWAPIDVIAGMLYLVSIPLVRIV